MKVGDNVQSGNTFLTCGVRDTRGPVSIGETGGVHFEGGPTYHGRMIEQWLENKDFQLNANVAEDSMRVAAVLQNNHQRHVNFQRFVDENKVHGLFDSRYKWSQAEGEE